MANWGAFVQGLGQSTQRLPDIMLHQQAQEQRQQEIDRREKQLAETKKQLDIKDAQEGFYKGLTLLDTLSDDVKPYVIDSQIKPAIQTLTKHGIMSYTDEQANSFLDKLKQNPSVAGQFSKDLLGVIKNNTDKKTGKINYKGILNAMDMMLPAYGSKMTKNDLELQKVIKENVAKQALGDTNVNEQDKPYFMSQLSSDAQKAFAGNKKMVEKTVDLGDKVEYIYTDGTRETKPKGKLPTTDETGQQLKYEKLNQSLTGQAMTQASKETQLKFNIQPQLQQGADGKIIMSFPNNPEAHQFYLNRVKELSDDKISRAVKRRALPKEYMPETPKTVAPKQDANMSKAVEYLKGSKDEAQAIANIQELHRKGWTKEQLNDIAAKAGWK